MTREAVTTSCRKDNRKAKKSFVALVEYICRNCDSLQFRSKGHKDNGGKQINRYSGQVKIKKNQDCWDL